MGAALSTRNVVENVTTFVIGKKRKLGDLDREVDKVIDAALNVPKRRKLLCTAKYIYEALFLEGKNSDITVRALGKDHHLHRVYLCQSPYFASMFSGSWLEATQKFINIDIVDPIITSESLKVVFGALYNSDIELNLKEIISVLATATMFQLEGLIEQCALVMIETLNPKTALDYYNAAYEYGVDILQKSCFEWYLINLMPHYFSNNTANLQLRKIPISLMTRLINHHDLVVIQTEYSIYVMLKYWIYLIKNPDAESPNLTAVSEYFQSRKDVRPYLDTDEGKEFIPVFKNLRLQYLVTHRLDLTVIRKDRIIPKLWLDPVIFNQWCNTLKVNQNEDKGPSNISEQLFFKSSLRCGRIINSPDRLAWRWTGFHFGIDLQMIADDVYISIKRSQRSEYDHLINNQSNRHIGIRVTIYKVDELTQVKYKKQTEILNYILGKGEEAQVMTIKNEIEYPILISANILFISTEDECNEINKIDL